MAVINVTPLMDITALIASNNVIEGDVLLLEEGIYFESVNVTKDFIRIVAKGPGVIFDGKSTLLTAFLLSDVVGVAIEGINIRHYRGSGLLIESGSGNRIVNNRINNMINDGIRLVSSSGNLIWKNQVCNCLDGVRLTLGSTNNWIIENIVKECLDDAFETVFSSESNNAFISNAALGNRGEGFSMLGSNNLVLNNFLDSGEGILIMNGNSSLVIGNKITGAKLSAIGIISDYMNFFAGENRIICNRREGMNLVSQYGMLLNNKIAFNGDVGISFFTPSAVGNLVMDNELVCNVPENIDDRGIDNVFINNIDKPCETCESSIEVCGHCSDEELIELENID
ncbi:MAG: hypothetical protein GX300_11480 [Tissierellia bacterium]|nr:hypothetical protein [Tissierellia bacterium]